LTNECISVKGNTETAEDHVSRRHLINEGVDPLREQQFVVRILSPNRDAGSGFNFFGIRNHSGERHGRLLKRFRFGAATPSYSHIGLV
jgi:hypothetical protein